MSERARSEHVSEWGTLMPAAERVEMAWGTPSCKRSSTAVAPSKVRLVSIASACAATASSLP